jgi:hypothetical protein
LLLRSYTSSSLSALASPLTSVQGASLYFDFIRGVYKNYLYVNGCRARVMDLLAANGVVHILECVPQARQQAHACASALLCPDHSCVRVTAEFPAARVTRCIACACGRRRGPRCLNRGRAAVRLTAGGTTCATCA